jgi:hypothetical protein
MYFWSKDNIINHSIKMHKNRYRIKKKLLPRIKIEAMNRIAIKKCTGLMLNAMFSAKPVFQETVRVLAR